MKHLVRATGWLYQCDRYSGFPWDTEERDGPSLAEEFSEVRREAIEECARACDFLKSSAVTCVDGDVAAFDDVYGGYQACEKCAATIRALMEQEPDEEALKKAHKRLPAADYLRVAIDKAEGR